MNEQSESLFWGVQGLLAGVAVSLLIAVLFAAFGGHIDLVEKWDTLFLGLLTGLAGSVAVIAAFSQIKQLNQHKREGERSHDLAARAAANVPLSNLCSYEETCIKVLRSISLPTGDRELPHQMINVSRYPTEDVSYIIACIPTADSLHTDRLSALVSKLQIQYSRLRGLQEVLSKEVDQRRNFIDRRAVINLIVDALEISATLNQVFHYVRRDGEVQSIGPSRKTIAEEAIPMFLEDDNDLYQAVSSEIERRFPEQERIGKNKLVDKNRN